MHPRANTSLHTLRLPYTHTRVQNRSTCKDILAHLHYNTSVQDHTSPCKYPLAHYVQKAPCTLTPMCTHLHTLTHASSHAQAHPCVQPCAFAHPRANTTLHTPMCASLVHYCTILALPTTARTCANRPLHIRHASVCHFPCTLVCKLCLGHPHQQMRATPLCNVLHTHMCANARAQLHTHVQNIPVHSHAALPCTRMCTNPCPSATATCAKPHSHVQRTPFTLRCSCTSVKRRPVAHSQAQPALHVATCNAHACAKPTIHLQSPLAHPLVQAPPCSLHPSTRSALHTHTPLTHQHMCATPR